MGNLVILQRDMANFYESVICIVSIVTCDIRNAPIDTATIMKSLNSEDPMICVLMEVFSGLVYRFAENIYHRHQINITNTSFIIIITKYEGSPMSEDRNLRW